MFLIGFPHVVEKLSCSLRFTRASWVCLSSSRVVKLWKENMSKVNQKAADALADPDQYSNLFPGLQQALLAEQYLKETHVGVRPAAEYPLVMVSFKVKHCQKKTCFRMVRFLVLGSLTSSMSYSS